MYDAKPLGPHDLRFFLIDSPDIGKTRTLPEMTGKLVELLGRSDSIHLYAAIVEILRET
jgi:hypothetical protein